MEQRVDVPPDVGVAVEEEGTGVVRHVPHVQLVEVAAVQPGHGPRGREAGQVAQPPAGRLQLGPRGCVQRVGVEGDGHQVRPGVGDVAEDGAGEVGGADNILPAGHQGPHRGGGGGTGTGRGGLVVGDC